MKFRFENLLIIASLLMPSAAIAAGDKTKTVTKEEIVTVLMDAEDRFSEGEYDAAIALYKQLIKIAPTNREGYLGLGRIELLRGGGKQAVAHFRKAISSTPQSAAAHFELGSAQLNLGNLKEALKELTTANELDPTRPEIQYRLSQARAMFDASKIASQKGGIKWPGGRNPHAVGGEAADNNSSPTLTPPVEPTPSTPPPKEHTANGDKPPEPAPGNADDPSSVDIDQASEVSLVYRLITSGRVEETLVQGLNALKEQPDNASLQYQLGLMYKVKGDVEKAIQTFEASLKDDPEHTQSLSQLTSLFISRNDFEKAKEMANRWVGADPDNPSAHFSLAWVFIVQKSFKDALPHLKSAAQLDPRNTELLNHLGLTLRELGDDQEASVYFQRALVLTPSASAPRLNLAMIQLYDQRNQDARELIKPLLDQPAVSPHTRSILALIDARDGRLDEAESGAQDVLKNLPNSAMASLALAIVAREKGKLDDAATILETTLKNHTKNTLVMHGLAEVYLSQGKTDKAIEYARTAHQRSPNKFLIAKTLALALAKANDTVVALDTLKQMRDLGDDPDKLFLLETAILEEADDREGALRHYLALAAEQPENDDVALRIAHIYYIDKKFKDANSAVDGILSRSSDNNQARLLKASILYELKDYKGCLKQAQQVAPDDDLDYETICLSARASFKLKRYPESAQLFKSARSKKPLSTDDIVMLVRSLRETKDIAEADQILAQFRNVKFQSKELKAELKRMGRASQ